MVERINPALPISQQCRLLAVPRSSVYRKPAEVGADDRLLDVACGTGYASAILARQLKPAATIGGWRTS